MAQRTPANPTSRFRSLSPAVLLSALFFKSGRASLQWPVLAKSPARFERFPAPRGAVCLPACAKEGSADRPPSRLPTSTREKVLNITMGKRRGHRTPDACPIIQRLKVELQRE